MNVFCVYWGNKYDVSYVYALKEMVNKYLTVPHTFKCITTEKIEGINTMLPYVPYYGWWQKIGLFSPRVATEPSIYFDLDVIITGNIDYLADYTSTFSAPANWAASGHGGIQSSVMCWPGNWNYPYEKFNYLNDKKKYWGDQEYLTELLGNNWNAIPHVGSYKYHCKNEIKKDLKIICFHGKPDPHEVTDKWILPYTLTLNKLIKLSNQSVLEKVL